jgi:hypothetical protein
MKFSGSQNLQITSFGGVMGLGKEQFGRLTTEKDDEVEFVHSIPVKGTPWVVNAHQNVGAIEGEIKTMRTTIIWSAALVGLLMAFPASVVARSISRTYEERIEVQSQEIAHERERSEQLLLTIFPATIAEQLKQGQAPPAEQYESVSILFADISGFTELASQLQPTDLVDLLNTIFTEFDSVAERVGVEKIKTIGDSYMAVAGLPITVTNHDFTVLRCQYELVCIVEQLLPELSERKNLPTTYGAMPSILPRAWKRMAFLIRFIVRKSFYMLYSCLFRIKGNRCNMRFLCSVIPRQYNYGCANANLNI